MDPSRVSIYSSRSRWYFGFQLDAAGSGLVTHSLDNGADDGGHVSRLESELQLTGDDTGYVQELTDQVVKQVSVSFNYVDAAFKEAFILWA